MTTRLASVSLVLGAALADAAGLHSLAYYALVAAVPIVAIAALNGLGDVLDGSAAEPHDRGVTCVVAALAIFAVQALVAATAVVPSFRAPPPISVLTRDASGTSSAMIARRRVRIPR